MLFISVTCEVSHPPISPLNVVFPENAEFIFVILEVSHPLIGPNVEFVQLPSVGASAKQSEIAPENVVSVNAGAGAGAAEVLAAGAGAGVVEVLAAGAGLLLHEFTGPVTVSLQLYAA
jgi:hypothetical protein